MLKAKPKLLTIREAADELRLKPNTLYQKIWRREIEFVKFGRNVRFRADVIERMIEEATVPALGER
jgi:excisionase family DNA binding protein